MRAYPVRRYKPVRTEDESGGSLKVPPADRDDYTRVMCDPVSNPEAISSLTVARGVEVAVDDFIFIPFGTFLRS